MCIPPDKKGTGFEFEPSTLFDHFPHPGRRTFDAKVLPDGDGFELYLGGVGI